MRSFEYRNAFYGPERNRSRGNDAGLSFGGAEAMLGCVAVADGLASASVRAIQAVAFFLAKEVGTGPREDGRLLPTGLLPDEGETPVQPNSFPLHKARDQCLNKVIQSLDELKRSNPRYMPATTLSLAILRAEGDQVYADVAQIGSSFVGKFSHKDGLQWLCPGDAWRSSAVTEDLRRTGFLPLSEVGNLGPEPDSPVVRYPNDASKFEAASYPVSDGDLVFACSDGFHFGPTETQRQRLEEQFEKFFSSDRPPKPKSFLLGRVKSFAARVSELNAHSDRQDATLSVIQIVAREPEQTPRAPRVTTTTPVQPSFTMQDQKTELLEASSLVPKTFSPTAPTPGEVPAEAFAEDLEPEVRDPLDGVVRAKIREEVISYRKGGIYRSAVPVLFSFFAVVAAAVWLFW